MTPFFKRAVPAVFSVLLSGVSATYPQYLWIVMTASTIAGFLLGVSIPAPGQAVVKTGFTVPPPNGGDPQQPQ